MYVYPQLFHLERPSFTLAVRYMPNTDLCGGGNVGTGQAPPCTECPDKIPFVPQDVFDLQWAEPVTSVVVRLPNGGTVPSAGIVSVNGVRIRISFCNAPPCFSVEINNQCTFLSFERVSCFVGCDEQPSPDDPNPIEPPPPTAQAAFVNIEHVRVSDWLRMSTNFVGVTDALCSFVRYPNTPVSYLASSRNGLGGAVAEHLHATTSGALVSVSITEGLAYFVGWAFDAPSMLVLGYTESGVYDPAPLPPVFVSGNATTPNITFIVPAGKYIHVFAMFDFNQTPPPMLYKAQSGSDTAEEFGVVEVQIGLISPNMGLFTLPENEVLVCNVEFQVGATSMNHVNLSASFWDSIDETTISTLIAYYKQFTTPINSGTNIRCTTKFVRIEEHIYVKSIITN
ncbi:MAG: hypothetical protein NZ519_12225, partial [Bacteroidia bacterium]|nr:hypothetical protein [Bacteroidia bacterium]